MQVAYICNGHLMSTLPPFCYHMHAATLLLPYARSGHAAAILTASPRLGALFALLHPAHPRCCIHPPHRGMQLRSKVDVEARGGGAGRRVLVSGSSQFRRKLVSQRGELRVELAVNARCLDSTTGYAVTPLHASLDIATPPNVPSALQYRLGVHQVGGTGQRG